MAFLVDIALRITYNEESRLNIDALTSFVYSVISLIFSLTSSIVTAFLFTFLTVCRSFLSIACSFETESINFTSFNFVSLYILLSLFIFFLLQTLGISQTSFVLHSERNEKVDNSE